MKLIIKIALGIILAFILLFVGCVGCMSYTAVKVGESLEESGTVSTTEATPGTQGTTPDQSQLELFKIVNHASVSTSPKNWDADAEDDGIIVYPELKDINNDVVKFSGIELKVDIELWTTELDSNWKEVKGRKVYSGTGTIDSWKDGNPFMDGGIKVSFDDINTVESDKQFGAILIKIHTPDGKVYEVDNDLVTRIKPE